VGFTAPENSEERWVRFTALENSEERLLGYFSGLYKVDFVAR